jgi:hypothetical protein
MPEFVTNLSLYCNSGFDISVPVCILMPRRRINWFGKVAHRSVPNLTDRAFLQDLQTAIIAVI